MRGVLGFGVFLASSMAALGAAERDCTKLTSALAPVVRLLEKHSDSLPVSWVKIRDLVHGSDAGDLLTDVAPSLLGHLLERAELAAAERAEVFYRRAVVLRTTTNPHSFEALQHLEAAVKLQPTHATYREALANFHWSRAHDSSRHSLVEDLIAAEEHYREALRLISEGSFIADRKSSHRLAKNLRQIQHSLRNHNSLQVLHQSAVRLGWRKVQSLFEAFTKATSPQERARLSSRIFALSGSVEAHLHRTLRVLTSLSTSEFLQSLDPKERPDTALVSHAKKRLIESSFEILLYRAQTLAQLSRPKEALFLMGRLYEEALRAPSDLSAVSSFQKGALEENVTPAPNARISKEAGAQRAPSPQLAGALLSRINHILMGDALAGRYGERILPLCETLATEGKGRHSWGIYFAAGLVTLPGTLEPRVAAELRQKLGVRALKQLRSISEERHMISSQQRDAFAAVIELLLTKRP